MVIFLYNFTVECNPNLEEDYFRDRVLLPPSKICVLEKWRSDSKKVMDISFEDATVILPWRNSLCTLILPHSVYHVVEIIS